MILNLILLGSALVIIICLGFYVNYISKRDRPPTLTERFIVFGALSVASILIIANLFTYIP